MRWSAIFSRRPDGRADSGQTEGIKHLFIHAEDLLSRYPDLPCKARDTEILKDLGAVFIYGIGWTLADGHPSSSSHTCPCVAGQHSTDGSALGSRVRVRP